MTTDFSIASSVDKEAAARQELTADQGRCYHGLFLKRHLMLAGCSKVFVVTTEGALVYAKNGDVFVGQWFGHRQDRRRKFMFAT
jgi:hypothetical protein